MCYSRPKNGFTCTKKNNDEMPTDGSSGNAGEIFLSVVVHSTMYSMDVMLHLYWYDHYNWKLCFHVMIVHSFHNFDE